MPLNKSFSQQLRLRIFAGPNGSGKSTIIQKVKATKQDGRFIDFGDYINADDITQRLRKNGKFSFAPFRLKFDNNRLVEFAGISGLLNGNFTPLQFINAYSVSNNSIQVINLAFVEQLGQVIARFLREEMLRLKRRFSFETVFSHMSNLDIMERANKAGYKVYLYFVSTESPEINKYRVALRVKNHGHDVPPEKIESRYKKALALMYDAAELAYQAFFFDNSKQDKPFTLVAHFKRKGEKKIWDKVPKKDTRKWFKNNYPTQKSSDTSKNDSSRVARRQQPRK